MKLFDYIVDRDGQVVLQGIEKPQSKFKSLTDIFQQALDHEREVTGMINKLYEKALSENDHATAVELQWFIHEQVEEEKSATEILDKLKLAGDNSSAILLLDSQLGARH
jgi:ferritin